MRVLIVYSTSEGQTEKISDFMAEKLRSEGHSVTKVEATKSPPSPLEFDFVFIGASVHAGKYQQPIKRYIKKNINDLNSVKSAFFSVSLAVASGKPEEYQEAEKILNHFLAGLNWKPSNTFHVAGALRYTQYKWLVKQIIKNIAKKQGGSTDTSKDHEFTNWDSLKTDTIQSLA